jgi:hypothetical protein
MIDCTECEHILPLEVLKSAAGYYVGYFCPNCGPFDRLTSYYDTRAEAEELKEAMDENLE